MKRLALMFCLMAVVFAGSLSVADTADAGPWRYRPRIYRPYAYRPVVVARPVVVPPYRVMYGPPVGYYAYPGWYGPPAVSVGVGWY